MYPIYRSQNCNTHIVEQRITHFDIAPLASTLSSKSAMQSNKESIGDVEEMPSEEPPRTESSGNVTKKEHGGNETILQEKQRIAGRWTKKTLVPATANNPKSGGETILEEKQRIAGRMAKKKLVPANANNSKSGGETILEEKQRIAGRMKKQTLVPADANNPKSGGETILQEKQRIAGRMAKKKLVPADDNNSKSGGETILQEKQRIAGRMKKKAAVPAGANNSNNREETILQEKQRIALRGKRGTLNNTDLGVAPGEEPPDRFANPDEEPSEVAPDAYPGAYYANDSERSSSIFSIDSGGFTTMTEDAMPNQPPDAQCSLPSSNNDPSIDTDAKNVNRRVMYWLAGIALLFTCIGAVVGIVVSLQKSEKPATLPPASPTVSSKGVLVELIQSRSPTTSFVNSTSAQSQALEWMLSDPYTLTLGQDDRLVQRFALVTLWYSTNGAIWSTDDTTYSVGWLAPVHECEWDAVGDGKRDLQCNSNKEVIQMYLLRGEDVSGHLPAELGLLSRLEQLDVSTIAFSGAIPTELALLTGLSRLDLSANTLSGSIPTEVGLMTRLTLLSLSANTLTVRA